jgi:hypothetical protein
MSLLQTFAISQPRNLDLKDIVMTGSDGKNRNLQIPVDKPTVIIILGVDCPISQKYIPVIEELRIAYLDKVEWIAVFPNYFSAEEVAAFRREYELRVTTFIDRDMNFIKRVNAHVTPEVFLIDSKSNLEYSGSIDDWFYELGRYRAKVSQEYLKNAIDDLLNGREIEKRSTEAIGCPIESPNTDHSIHRDH